MGKRKEHIDNEYSFERVPKTVRNGFLPMFFIMLGFTFFSASMSVGATLGNSFELGGFAVSILLGGILLACYTGALAYIGSDTGLSFDLLAQRAFGRYGSFLPSAMIAATQIGWFGVGVAMFAIPGSQVIGCDEWVLVSAAGICMTASAYFGIKGMEIVSYISVPLIMVLGIYSMVTASEAGGGIAAIFAKSTGKLTLFEGVGLVIGSFISGGTTTPNFARFAKTRKAAVISTVIAFFIGNSLMFSFGAVGGAFTGKEDIFYVMIAQGLTIPALIVLGANIWTTNDNALYSGALSISNISRVPKRPLVIIAGMTGTVAAMWIYDNFVSWLVLLNAVLPPIGAILILDYFLNRSKFRTDDTPIPAVDIGSVAGVVLGALTGWFINAGISSVNAMLVACACYMVKWVIVRCVRKKQ